MEMERNVKLEKHGEIILAVKDYTRCPYTTKKDWDGTCYDGKVCGHPYLDLVFLDNYCRQKQMTFWMIEELRKNKNISSALPTEL